MSKVAGLLVLTSCAVVAAGLLSGCSAGALPGAPGASSKPAAQSPQPSDDLVAVPTDCPKASEVSALIGFAVPDPSATHGSQSLECTYAGASATNAAQINFHSAPGGTTAASVKAELESGASAGDIVTPISGFGEAAFTAQPAGGGAVILVWNKGVEFSVVDGHDLDGVERVALGILAG
ncbi:MAG TPA: hypothetical protein VIJ11_07255 [Galbitalea sp.]